ncbi:MAG: Gfo/Idh/MocA family oxidoreductase [Thermofilaceae archaeon]|nr:Gfo/Idh/MocA family oxidoreductase [Thermofilaceae archaeon]MCX8180908.1 Gfo/Idh/MocA family oxidoreductase [Thermofilaceae archaeon]MDW8003473.1 Gfo/Idh/MocA family oxidoreductase [Thermofilaceae archaeon]
MKKLKVGIIGAGGIANNHAHYYRELPDVELSAVADVAQDRAREFALRWGIPPDGVFSEFSEMLRSVELDAVSICTPHKVHAKPAVEALKRGIHVLVEKPMASCGSEALEMYKAARSSGKILMVGFQTRWSPELRVAKRIVASGALGRVYYAETTLGGRRRGIPGSATFTKKDLAGGGVLLDLGCYAIDNIMFVLGHPKPLAVSASIESAVGGQKDALVEGGWAWNPESFEVEDFVSAFIRFENGLTVLLKESWAMHLETLGSPFILGTKGGLRLSPLELYRDEWGYMANTSFKLPQVDIYRERIRNFVEAVKKGGPSPIDPREIVMEMFIIDSIYESASKRKEVDVKLPAELFS